LAPISLPGIAGIFRAVLPWLESKLGPDWDGIKESAAYQRLLEFVAILETCGPLEEMFRAMADPARLEFTRRFQRRLEEMSPAARAAHPALLHLFDEEWLARVSRLTELPCEGPVAELRKEFRSLCVRIIGSALRWWNIYNIAIMKCVEAWGDACQPDCHYWRAAVAEKLCAADRRAAKFLSAAVIRWVRDRHDWDGRFEAWCSRAESVGCDRAYLRHYDRMRFGRGAVPHESYVDRIMDVLIADRGTGILDVAGLSESELAELAKAEIAEMLSEGALSAFVPKPRHGPDPKEDGGASPRNPERSRWITVTDAEKVTGVSKGTISRAAKKKPGTTGALASNGLRGRDLRIDAHDLVRWKKERADKPEPRESNEAVDRKCERAGLTPPPRRNNRP
jgi:hypothetical protein